MSLAVSCFAIFSAFCQTLLQNPPDLILEVDDISLKFRSFKLAVLGNRTFTLLSWKPSKDKCAQGQLRITTGWIPFLLYALFVLRLSKPAMHARADR